MNLLNEKNRVYRIITILTAILLLAACKRQSRKEVVDTPWGTTITTDGGEQIVDTVSGYRHYSLDEIRQGGELIMLTLSGPETYYDYHGKGMGLHYLLCEKLAENLGVTLRVDVCRDVNDMLQRLRNGEGDIVAYPVKKEQQKGFIACGVRDSTSQTAWVVGEQSIELAQAVAQWYKPAFYAEMKKQEDYMLSAASVKRHVYPFMLSAKEGMISHYDVLFRTYAPMAGLDWMLMAAQCYQESCFDPNAHSWAGACGLMQIIPTTADHLGLPRHKIYDPKENVSAAARYMRQLQNEFKDIANPMERIQFALAAYNGGYHHIRDAMALTKKHGGIPQRWSDVRRYVLALSNSTYYNDEVVKNGYMRGSETVNYVDMIMERWQKYRVGLRDGTLKPSAKTTSKTLLVSPIEMQPHRAAKKNKWRKE